LPNSVFLGEKGNCRHARLWGLKDVELHRRKANNRLAAFDLRDPASLLPYPAKAIRLS